MTRLLVEYSAYVGLYKWTCQRTIFLMTVRFSHMTNFPSPLTISRLSSLSPKVLILFNFPYFYVKHLTLLSSKDNTSGYLFSSNNKRYETIQYKLSTLISTIQRIHKISSRSIG